MDQSEVLGPQLSAFQKVNQAVSLSTTKPLSQPANKPTASFHSVGPLAWDQVMPLNKELLSCITSPQRGQPGHSLLSPGAASLKHTKASATAASLLHPITSLLPLYHSDINPVPTEGVSFQLSGESTERAVHEQENNSSDIFKYSFNLYSLNISEVYVLK